MDSHEWDTRYREKELVWAAEPNLFLPPIVGTLEPGTALDLACGEGRNAIWLARSGWNVTAVDFSPVAVEKAKTVAGDTVVDWVVADITAYEPEPRFDLVIIVYVHLEPAGMEAVFTNAARAVVPGGTLIAMGHALRNLADGTGGPQYPEILWTEDRIAPLLDGLDVISLSEALRPVEDSPVDAIDILAHATKP